MRDFFEQQDRARKQSGRLVFLFGIALIGIVLATYLVALFVYDASQFMTRTNRYVDGGGWDQSFWRPGIFALDVLVVLAVTGIAALHRLNSLRGGGAAVAAMLGARYIAPGTQEPRERRLVNVVEEMALASGVPVPQVFVLDDEPGINAFAAGYSVDNAAVTVTDGLLERLDRDEIQGVVAHEFSHIFSGDMRLKSRLIAALFGITVLAIIGRLMLHILPRVRTGRGEGFGFIAVLAVAGALLMIIGAVGLFMGRVIKAAVSRQREYLADAAAVQYTRNPDGLAGALKKISRGGSRLHSRRAEEASHLFFASSASSFLSRILATHPPIEERIRRLDPYFKGDLSPASIEGRERRTTGLQNVAGIATSDGGRATEVMLAAGEKGARAVDVKAQAQELIDRVGGLDSALLDAGASLGDKIPAILNDALEHPFSASAVVFAMLLVSDTEEREKQYSLIREHSGPALLQETLRLEDSVERLAPMLVLPCAQLALPALRAMDAKQRRVFSTTAQYLIGSDFELSVREFAIARTVLRQLEASSALKPVKLKVDSRAVLKRESAVLLSVLARTGHKEPARIEDAFAAGMEFLSGEEQRPATLLPEGGANLEALGRSLSLLARAPLEQRGKLLEACVRCVLHDDKLVVDEVELIQVVAGALDLPLPPIHPA